MGNNKINPYKSVQHIFLVRFNFQSISIDNYGSKHFDAQRPSAKNEITQREADIQRSQTLLRLEQAVLEQRGRMLRAQEDIIDVRKSLNEIRERLIELSE